MGTALTITAWLIALWCAWVTLSSAWTIVVHAVRTRRLWNAPGWPVVPLEHATVMVTALALLGVLPEPGGALAAALAGVPLAIVLVMTAVRDGLRHALAIAAWTSPRQGATLALGGARHFRAGPRPRRMASPAAGAAAAPAPPVPSAAAAAGRAVPPLREDPALAPPPAPEEFAAGAAVPLPWAELAGWIAGFVPEDDNEQSAFLAGTAAGLVAVAQAIAAHSEVLVNDVGADPAYGAAILEVGERVAECSGDVALADRRWHVIYDQLKAAIENGLVLPHNARQFLGGGGSTPAAGGTAAA